MANCDSLICIPRGCEPNNSGGITSFFIVDQSAIPSTGVTVDVSAHTVTDINLTESFVEFKIPKNTASMTTTATISFENGSTYYPTTITLMLPRRMASTSYALQLLGAGQREMAIIYTDANGLSWYVPNARLSGGEETTGTVKQDGSKYTIEFTADLDNRPYYVTPEVVFDVTTNCES